MSGNTSYHPHCHSRGTALVPDALAVRHFGQVLYAYRHGHRPVLTQARVGRWLGLTQG